MPIIREPIPEGLQPKIAENSYENEERRSSYLKKLPPLRRNPFEEDPENDRNRIEYVQEAWHSQDDLLRGRDRQVEENIRMLCGQHWSVWSEVLGRFMDLTDYLTDDERRWRQFPVMNRLLLWFMITHARMTENPPIVAFQPATGDQLDADLAEVCDPIFKHLWREASMLDVLDRATAWLIPSGAAYLKSRIDPEAGELMSFIGRATLALLDADGTPVMGTDGGPIQRTVDNVPFNEQGEPNAKLFADGRMEQEPAYSMREGGIVVDPLSCLEVRGEWGNNIPWGRKRWHIHKAYHTPQSFYETYGIDHPPEVTGTAAEAVQEFHRLAFGSGLFGTAGGQFEQALADGALGSRDGYIETLEMWMRPSALLAEMQETMESPGGRIITVTRSKCIRDSARFARFRNTSPIRELSFVSVPGRPQGTSPQEMLNGPTRTRNRMMRQVLEHTNLVANPLRLVDKRSGIQEGQITNRPGQTLYGIFKKDSTAVDYVKPPDLGRDVYQVFTTLTAEHDELGSITGAMGDPPTTDPSGELVKELRFNSDRYIGPTQRRTVTELARMVEDWMVLLPIIWDREKTIKVAGDENVIRTITVYPEMFVGGSVDVVPDIESMLPEGRGERQQRVFALWQNGAWGPPDAPEARAIFLELAHFPHLSRAYHPGGADMPTAKQNVGKLLTGVPAAAIPIFEWYDHTVHLGVLERFMKGTEYLKQPVFVQQQMVLYRDMLRQALMLAQQQMIAQQMALQAMMAPPPEEDAGGGGSREPGKAPDERRRVGPEPPPRGPTREIPGGL